MEDYVSHQGKTTAQCVRNISTLIAHQFLSTSALKGEYICTCTYVTIPAHLRQ
jgi:hypothetical protein